MVAKQGQHKGDARDSDKSRGHNNPSQSQVITAGTSKKEETYAKRAREHKDPDPVAQDQRNEWNPDTHDEPGIAGSTRARDSSVTSGRSGSDSNASANTRGH